uniref:Uncharacterized protein n=1 Tax=Arundo donax TaxID=35708 RepID=A0A0A9GZS9_ARUDO
MILEFPSSISCSRRKSALDHWHHSEFVSN